MRSTGKTAYHDQPARLMFVYFIGDWCRIGWDAPQDEDGWRHALEEMYDHVGVRPGAEPTGRVHTLFLPVSRPKRRKLGPSLSWREA